jgi:hypothetical protein
MLNRPVQTCLQGRADLLSAEMSRFYQLGLGVQEPARGFGGMRADTQWGTE